MWNAWNTNQPQQPWQSAQPGGFGSPPPVGPPFPGTSDFQPPQGPPPGPPPVDVTGNRGPYGATNSLPYSWNPRLGGPPPAGYATPSPAPSASGGYPGGDWRQNHAPQQHAPAYAQQPYNNQPAPYGAPPMGNPHLPPSTPQFTPNHQYQYQYSQCSGRKKALCIGINYKGYPGELRGCINDAKNMKQFLQQRFGYKSEDMVMLLDDAANPRQLPTRANIIAAMQWLVRDAKPNDSLWFHYSGHGGQTKDLDGDEADGYDEVIYPLDHKKAGHITDDEMHSIMVRPLPIGCRLTSIFDSCHSGSVLDLPYIYSTEGKIKEPNTAAEAGKGALSAISSYARGDYGGVLSAGFGILKVATGSTEKAQAISRQTRTSPADVISWSGCKDSQTSADAFEAGRATGAMSHAFILSMNQQPQQTYQQLLVSVREILRVKYSQKPQLSASHEIDTSILFIA